jgi:hypothetical protein
VMLNGRRRGVNSRLGLQSWIVYRIEPREEAEELCARGLAFGFRRTGSLSAYRTEEGFRAGLEEARLLTEHGVVGRSAVEREPLLREGLTGPCTSRVVAGAGADGLEVDGRGGLLRPAAVHAGRAAARGPRLGAGQPCGAYRARYSGGVPGAGHRGARGSRSPGRR